MQWILFLVLLVTSIAAIICGSSSERRETGIPPEGFATDNVDNMCPLKHISVLLPTPIISAIATRTEHLLDQLLVQDKSQENVVIMLIRLVATESKSLNRIKLLRYDV